MVALISVSALFGSCQKEQQELTRLNLIAEGFQNNKATKLAVDGLASYWVDGEKVYINDNSDVTISYSGGTSASASGTFTTPIRAIYPASICSSALTASSATHTTSSYSELYSAKFKVVRDFDASSSTYSDFTRIYNCQEFDGQGHTISYLRINSDGAYCGMFRSTGNIKNLTLYNPKLLVNTNAFYIGPLVSAYNYDLIISNCTITSPTVEIKTNLTSSTHRIGGMVGTSRGLTMTNCRVTNFNMYYDGGEIQSSLCFGDMLEQSDNSASYAVKMEISTSVRWWAMSLVRANTT